TANGNPSVHMPIPNRYYESVRGWSSSVLSGIAGNAPIEPITDKVRQVDYHGHFTAGAGHALYTARAYPREYWNRTAFIAESTGSSIRMASRPHRSLLKMQRPKSWLPHSRTTTCSGGCTPNGYWWNLAKLT